MKSIRTLVALCSVISVLAACGGGDGNDLGTELGISKPQARFINAVPAGPNLDYYLNAKVDASGVAYKGVTRYHDIDSGGQTASYDVSGTNTTVASQSFNAANGHHYTTIALPSTSSAISVVDDPYGKGLLSDKARVRSFNASPNAQNVDVYVVPPNTDITTQTPTLTGAAYQNASPPSGQDSVYLNGGTYQIIVTTAGSKSPILKTAPVTLNNNADWLIVTIPSGGIGDVTPNDIHVLVAQGNDADTSAQELGPQ
ncbi:DUF4397 domain-containing protein [Burkholderia multivorans]|uniref:DUF4397 domain-containing protein n=1 Tax=Burkholderia multivorans TaxID=87883 RepID=UPI000277CF15|nr:DUF4397 domain-containing protein [Burkholderia multivorans]AJY16588.1 hypothetical protein NP80_4064 [Burkholderia multivorans ATCC BAA-247]AVR19473.1 DUF4397 domain-containing protein [Burkholderia multivorans]EJO56808.1 putative lipoprotein [Burkholderia multivorans ATCC BAA-247]MBU9493061.1 DUF4397 domain-containing protein [Burkholderia multivorans]MCO1438966.1 DUF4397 domain-containing protein [Burkholderia multivorans]